MGENALYVVLNISVLQGLAILRQLGISLARMRLVVNKGRKSLVFCEDALYAEEV